MKLLLGILVPGQHLVVLPLIFPGSSFTNTFSVFCFILNLTNFCHLSSSGRRKRCPTLNVFQLLLAFWHYLLLCLILNLSTCLSMHMLDFVPLSPLKGPWWGPPPAGSLGTQVGGLRGSWPSTWRRPGKSLARQPGSKF